MSDPNAASVPVEGPADPPGDREAEGEEEPWLRVRPYALTGGRTRSEVELPIETIVRVTPRGLSAAPRLESEQRRIVTMSASPLSIAELSAHLHLPLGVVRVLVGDLVGDGLLQSHVTDEALHGERPDVSLLERVLDGLQAL
jgi:hypothetical protein